MQTPSLQRWTRAMLILGGAVTVIAIAPALVDIFVFGGRAAHIAGMVLVMLSPLAVIALLVGLLLYLVGLFRRFGAR